MSWEMLNQFVIKEHIGVFKAANNFDVFDAYSGEPVLYCREENLGMITKLLRFSDYKRMTPFCIQIRDTQGNLVIEVSRGISIFLSHIQVKDASGRLLGTFKQKLFSLGGAFNIFNVHEHLICKLKGKWTGWEFSFESNNGIIYAQVSKKWSGIGKELFTSADNYLLSINNTQTSLENKKLILAAVMCIDMVLKE